MAIEQKGFCVRILEKDFRIACSAEQEQALQEAASLLDKHMVQIRQSGKVMGIERIAVMAALNIAFELLHLKNEYSENEEALKMRLQVLQQNIDKALKKPTTKSKVSKFYSKHIQND